MIEVREGPSCKEGMRVRLGYKRVSSMYERLVGEILVGNLPEKESSVDSATIHMAVRIAPVFNIHSYRFSYSTLVFY